MSEFACRYLGKTIKAVASLLVLILAVCLILEVFFRLTEVVWKPVYQALFDDKEKIYIYTLGESTSEGVQYQDKISPAILVAHQFNNRINNKQVEIISLAQSGEKAEYMYFRFYFHVLFAPHRNGLVLTYSGINEGIENTAAYNFKYWEKAQRSVVISKLMYISGKFTNDPIRYEYRYRQVCRVAKQYGYQVVLSQLVGNVKDYDPDVKTNDTLAKGENRKLLEEAENLFANANYNEAEAKYTVLLNTTAYQHPFLLFRIAHCKYETGYCDTAAALLGRLPEANNYSGYAAWKNRIIEKVAAKEKVGLAKTFERFRDSSEYRLVGHNLINDAHHPNLKGYCIMANTISSEVSRLYHQPVFRMLSPEQVAKDFNFDSAFYAGVYFKLTEWYIFKTFDTEMRSTRLNRVKLYAAKCLSLKRDDESRLLWQLLISVLEKDKHGFAKALSGINASNNQQPLFERLEHVFTFPQYAEKIRSVVLPWKNDKEMNQELLDNFISRLD